MSYCVAPPRISQSFAARASRFAAVAGTRSAAHAETMAEQRSSRFDSHLNGTFPSSTSAAGGISACSMNVAHAVYAFCPTNAATKSSTPDWESPWTFAPARARVASSHDRSDGQALDAPGSFAFGHWFLKFG